MSIGPRSRTILVLAISATVFLVFNLMINYEYTWGDERAFTIAGNQWIRGLLEGKEASYYVSGYTLQRTSDSPPLSKIITGSFSLLLSKIGYGSYPIPIRIHSSLFLAGICTISYLIGRSLAGDSAGFVAWILLLFQPILQPQGPEICLASLDITYLFFIATSVYFMLNPESLRNLLIASIFFGFASLSKYTAFFILPPFFFVWILLHNRSLKETIKSEAIFLAVGVFLHLLLNPYLTDPILRETMISWQFREGNAFFKWASNEIPLVQTILDREGFDITIVKLIIRFYTLATELLMSYYLLQLSIMTLFYAAWRKESLTRDELMPFLWFAFSLLFMQIHSKHFFYYDIILFPGLALFLSTFWKKRILK